MKKHAKLSLLLAIAMLIAGCGENDSGWDYTRDDMSNFTLASGVLEDDGKNAYSFNVDTGFDLLSRDLNISDVLLYDVNKAKENFASSGKEYADYSILKSASIAIKTIETNEDKEGFNVTFENDSFTNYGMLIKQDASASKQFIMISQYLDAGENNIATDPQSEFEKKYCESEYDKDSKKKFVYDILSNLVIMLVAYDSKNPTTVVSGIFNILSTLLGMGSEGSSMAAIMNQLKETDAKIDEINKKIDENTKQLSDSIVRNSALVEEANLNVLNLAINDFVNVAENNINSFNRRYANAMSDAFKDYISQPESVDLLLYQSEDNNQWASTPLGDFDGREANFSLNIEDFPNAKAALASKGGIVEDGFIDAFSEDVLSAANQCSNLPKGLDATTLRDFALSMILENFAKAYYSNNKSKAEDYQDYVISLAQRISGSSGAISILNSYLDRFKFMYNFGKEIKPQITTLCSNLLYVLDYNTARAAQGLFFAGYSSSELEKEYFTARAAIKNLYNGVQEIPDSYSFTTNAKLTGDFYRARYNVSYTNLGNHCTFHNNFEFAKVRFNGMKAIYTEDDISSHYSLNYTQQGYIVSRWNLLRSIGMNESSDYITYLGENEAIDNEGISSHNSMLKNRWIGNDSYRILTSNRNVRDMNNTDTSLSMSCVARGNPGGKSFTLNNRYNFRGAHESSDWSGKIYEGTYIDGASGLTSGVDRICAYATYAEDHWYWSNDEYWAFLDNPSGAYFFLLDIATE